MKSAHKTDLALLAHEQCHQQQMLVHGTITFWVKYLLSRKFRQAAEVEAYKVQIANGATSTACAVNLATKYWLNLTFADAYNLLK